MLQAHILRNSLEGHAVRPFQGDTCSNHRINGLFSKLNFDPRQVASGLHRVHLLLGRLVETSVEFGGMFVVRPSVEVLRVHSQLRIIPEQRTTYVEVPLQTCSALGLRVTGIDTGFLLKSIALIPAGAVLGPWSHTHPAELPLALLAGHVAKWLDQKIDGTALRDTHLQPPFFSIVD